ncbi:MAG TPA: DUF542 domain-containing protein [Chloroflexota bacterium]
MSNLDKQAVVATPIGMLLADHPALAEVLDRYGLDTCCGGHLTVPEAAAEHGLDTTAVLDAITEALARSRG